MSYLDIYGLKKDIVNIFRKHLYPRQTITADFYDATLDAKYAQQFIPFSTSMNSISVYCNTVGTNLSDLTISIQTDQNNSPSGFKEGEVVFSPSEITNDQWDTKRKDIDLVSKNKYWLVFETSGTSTDYYRIGRDNTRTRYQEGISKRYISSWNTIPYDLSFKIDIDHWIYPHYPSDTVSQIDMPRLAVDVYDRSTAERYCDSSIALADIKVIVVGYSQYSDELDKIFSYGERGLFKDRTSLSNVDLITPLNINPLDRIREKLYSRSVNYNLRKKLKYLDTVPTIE